MTEFKPGDKVQIVRSIGDLPFRYSYDGLVLEFYPYDKDRPQHGGPGVDREAYAVVEWNWTPELENPNYVRSRYLERA